MARQHHRLWAAFYFPRFPVETFGQGSVKQVCDVVVNDTSSAPTIIAASAEVEAEGIVAGLSLSAALAILPQLTAWPRDQDAERNALLALAAWSEQYTSLACPVHGEHPGLLLEIGESLRLFGDARTLATDITDGLLELGFAATWAIAPTPTAAWLLARSGHTAQVYAVSQLRDALAAVPVHCLDLSQKAIDALSDVGVQCLQQCWDLPRAETARRIGPDFWEQLDRASAKRADPRRPYRAPERLFHKLNLPAPVIGVEALLFALGRLLRQLQGVLIARGNAVQVLELVLGLSGGGTTHVAIELIAPSRDVKHLLGLLRHRLEAMSLPDAIEQVSLEASQCVSLAPRNLDLFDNRVKYEDEWVATLERLHARLGTDRVQGLAVNSEHRPEYAWRPVTPRLSGPDEAKTAGKQRARSGVSSAPEHNSGYGPDYGLLRPLWLLAEPCSLEVREGTPCYGSALAIETSAERIEGGWWEGNDVSRDYHVATNNAGERYWIYHDRRQRAWFLHGVFS